jgi:hypothetical protein
MGLTIDKNTMETIKVISDNLLGGEHKQSINDTKIHSLNGRHFVESDTGGTELTMLKDGDDTSKLERVGNIWDVSDNLKDPDIRIGKDGTLYREPKAVYATPVYERRYREREPDTYVAPIIYNEPVQPKFTSNIQEITKYEYFFGLDNLNLLSINTDRESCFVSKSKAIGELTSNEYVELDASYTTPENSSIEFYIVDGTMEIPILPLQEKMISNEKIFYGLSTRFVPDKSQPIIIKKDGEVSSLTLEVALKNNDGVYTVSYSPLNAYKYKPLTNAIKVKVILRLYGNTKATPTVSKIKIRKHGGNLLWQDI